MVCKGMVEQYRTLRQCARGVGLVALVFSLTVAALLAAGWYRAGASETVRSEILAQALARGRDAPEDAQVVAFARELDLLARKAYLGGMTFRQKGMALLAVGLLATAACFGLAWRVTLKIPDPRTASETDPARADRWAVNAVLSAGAALVAGAAVLHFIDVRRGRGPSADRALRGDLTNRTLKTGEKNICPCRLGTRLEDLEEYWPFMLGPTMSGRAARAPAALEWNGETGKNIRWRVALDESGSSTPAVWDHKIFITSGNKSERAVMAHDTESGARLWKTLIPDGEKAGAPLPDVMAETGFAASSPACDERMVYAVFGTGDIAALDHAGRIVWQRYLGRPKNSYGHASSLVYCGEMLIVQWDQDEQARVMALNKSDGRTLWETPRELGMSWSTPLVMPLCDNFILLVHATHSTWGMELASGKKLWEVEAVSGEVAPSLAWEGDVWLAANCYSRMVAFKQPPDGAPQQLWEFDESNMPDVASPVISGGLVFLVTDAGEVLCHD
ncbi:MAG: PQQ-binding-like beta-propeller repeat protein, partial [Kiritimatiellae bacterium]|nr:PQQ-binding-like beta-propeller repeat protein [Kiritimatiellia bacterium]